MACVQRDHTALAATPSLAVQWARLTPGSVARTSMHAFLVNLECIATTRDWNIQWALATRASTVCRERSPQHLPMEPPEALAPKDITVLLEQSPPSHVTMASLLMSLGWPSARTVLLGTTVHDWAPSIPPCALRVATVPQGLVNCSPNVQRGRSTLQTVRMNCRIANCAPEGMCVLPVACLPPMISVMRATGVEVVL